MVDVLLDGHGVPGVGQGGLDAADPLWVRNKIREQISDGSRDNSAAQQYIHYGECEIRVVVDLDEVSKPNAHAGVDTVEVGVVEGPSLGVCVEEYAHQQPEAEYEEHAQRNVASQRLEPAHRKSDCYTYECN